VCFELDYLEDEEVDIAFDVYNMTIAANMTKTCSPVSLNLSLKFCIMVFLTQTTLAYFYSKDFLLSSNF